MPDKPFLRRIIGGLLIFEALVTLLVAIFVVMIGGLTTALAIVVTAGDAPEKNVTQTFAFIAFSVASPFVLAALLAAGGVFLILRKRRNLVIAAGVSAIIAQVVLHHYFVDQSSVVELLPFAWHLLVIGLAVAFVPARSRT